MTLTTAVLDLATGASWQVRWLTDEERLAGLFDDSVTLCVCSVFASPLVSDHVRTRWWLDALHKLRAGLPTSDHWSPFP